MGKKKHSKFDNSQTPARLEMERHTVLAKLELPYFIERAFVQKTHCRLLFQVQENALHTLYIWVELFWNSVVNLTTDF